MTTVDPSPFGTLLKTFRITAGLTQEELAERARLSTRGLQDLERGLSRRPRYNTVDLLASALGLSAQDRARFSATARGSAVPVTHATVVDRSTTLSDNTLTPLVGRARELALLGRFLRGQSDIGPAQSLLLMAGEPGVGKTRLLEAVARQAHAEGWRVLTGGCLRRDGQEPYAPLVDALARYIHELEPERRREELAGCAWLSRLLPMPAEGAWRIPAVSPTQERRLIFGAVERFLTNVAGPAGTLLILDDLQWAGPDALDLVNTLARVTTLPLRIAGAYRDTEIRPADPLNFLLADLAQAGLVRLHPLGPLDLQDAAALLDDLLAGMSNQGRTTTRVLERADRMPFFLVSYAQALRSGASEEEVPWDLAQTVRQRVAMLPEAARQLLGVAAIAGRRVPRALLVAAAGQPEDEVPAGLEAACRARLLQEMGDEEYLFGHDVIREVAEADLGAARRAVLHRRVAEALESDPISATTERLAYHFARGNAPEKAVYYLEQAGDHAGTQQAHAAAERYYRETLEHLEPLGRFPDVLRVREKLSEVLYQTGRYSAASQVLEPAAEALRAAGDWERLGEITARIGWMHSLAGTPHEGLTLIQPLLKQLEQSSAVAPTAALYATLGQLAIAAGQYSMSEVANQRAVELARACGDQRSHVRAEYNRLVICQALGRLRAALTLGNEVLPLAERVGHLNTQVGVPRDLAYIHALRGAFGQSRRFIEWATLAATKMRDPGPVAFTQALHGWILFLSGETPAARVEVDAAVELSRQGRRSWYSPYPLIVRAGLLLAEEERPPAVELVQEALVLAELNGDPQSLRWASSVMAELDILEGRPDAGRDRLLPLLDRPGLEECDVTLFLPVLAWAHLELDQMDLAADTVNQALVRARPEEMRLVLVEALRVRAMIALRQEQWDEAASSLEEGLALARSMPYPYAKARLLALRG